MKDPPLQANLRELIELPAGAGARVVLHDASQTYPLQIYEYKTNNRIIDFTLA